MSSLSFRRGFTILEILIVIAVFGLLVALAALSLRSSRMRLRDTQRISDVSALRNGLSQYWFEQATYPVSAGADLGRPGTNTDVFTTQGFGSAAPAKATVLLPRTPIGPTAGEYYRYKGGPNGYSLRFVTESDTIYGKANVFYAHASGVDNADEEK